MTPRIPPPAKATRLRGWLRPASRLSRLKRGSLAKRGLQVAVARASSEPALVCTRGLEEWSWQADCLRVLRSVGCVPWSDGDVAMDSAGVLVKM